MRLVSLNIASNSAVAVLRWKTQQHLWFTPQHICFVFLSYSALNDSSDYVCFSDYCWVLNLFSGNYLDRQMDFSWVNLEPIVLSVKFFWFCVLCFAFLVAGGGSLFQTSTCLHICVYALGFLSFNYTQQRTSQYFMGACWVT